jgi:prepilin-type processing-associated H-X9-DG protein
MMLLPGLTPRRNHGSAARIKCANNLKQVALAYRVFADDNDGKFPFLVVNSLAYGEVTQTWLHFQAMSNELATARILICAADRERLNDRMDDFGMNPLTNALSLSSKGNRAVSYTASLDADTNLLNTILSSDRHLLTTSANLHGRLFLARSNVTTTAWTPSLHNGAGNYALSDGSVQQMTSSGLTAQVRMQEIATNRLLLPMLP